MNLSFKSGKIIFITAFYCTEFCFIFLTHSLQISRLHALKDLHERAAQFASSVAVMADSQDQLTRQTTHLQSLLTKVVS